VQIAEVATSLDGAISPRRAPMGFDLARAAVLLAKSAAERRCGDYFDCKSQLLPRLLALLGSLTTPRRQTPPGPCRVVVDFNRGLHTARSREPDREVSE